MIILKNDTTQFEIPKHYSEFEDVSLLFIHKITHTNYPIDAIIEDGGMVYKIKDVNLNNMPTGEYEYLILNGLDTEGGIVLIGEYNKINKIEYNDEQKTIQYEQ